MNYEISKLAALKDRGPDFDEMMSEIREGLLAIPKTLPCKYFYDEKGSDLFRQICELPEYY